MPEVTLTSKLEPVAQDIAFTEDNRETMVKVSHVSMEFNMASEQLNSLKEYAIALMKRNLYFKKFTALDDISFEVKKGDVFGILGTNGSGKSTLLKIIAGVLTPTKGTCDIKGNVAPLIELGAGFDMELSARENIYLNGSLLGYSKSFIDEHFNDIVKFAEVEKFLDMPMKNYSSGMVARIAFAIATVIVPEILIVDEVLSVGDFMFQQKCEDRITELIEKHGVTVLIVSHSNDQIERLCDKAIWIEKGHERIMGDASEVCNAYRILGGRTGSSESEAVIYRNLRALEIGGKKIVPYEMINGDNHFEIAVNLAHRGWDKDVNTAILIPDYTHTFSTLITSISSILDAPVLPISNDELPFCVEKYLIEYKPKNILIYGYEDFAQGLSDQLHKMNLACNVKIIPCERSIKGLQKSILDFGIKNDYWKSQEAILVSFSNQQLCHSIANILTKDASPVIMLFDDDNDEDFKVIDKLKEIGISKILIDSFIDKPELLTYIKNSGISTNLIQNDQIVSFDNEAIVVSNSVDAKWQNLLSIGAFCTKKDASLILYNNANLDDIAECINSIQAIKPEKVFAVSDNSITKREIETLIVKH